MSATGDYLEDARLADQELALQIERECRRAVPVRTVVDVGPTEAWRQYLADTDPEWDEAA